MDFIGGENKVKYQVAEPFIYATFCDDTRMNKDRFILC